MCVLRNGFISASLGHGQAGKWAWGSQWHHFQRVRISPVVIGVLSLVLHDLGDCLGFSSVFCSLISVLLKLSSPLVKPILSLSHWGCDFCPMSHLFYWALSSLYSFFCKPQHDAFAAAGSNIGSRYYLSRSCSCRPGSHFTNWELGHGSWQSKNDMRRSMNYCRTVLFVKGLPLALEYF